MFQVTPVAFTDIGWRYFIVYAVLNAAWVPVIYFFFPETAGRSLEELDEIFAASKTIFDPVRMAKNLPKRHLAEFIAEEHIKVDGEELKVDSSYIEDTKEA